MTDQPTSPPPPPPYTPPPPPPTGGKAPNTLMIILAYLGPLALVPLLVEKDDREVQWHAKHGIVLLVAEIAIGIIFTILGSIPGVGCISCAIYPIVFIPIVIVHVICIVKGLKGERFIIPGISQYADRF